MKILFNTMSLGKGGAERVISILSNELVKNNNVEIITHLNMPIEYAFDKNINVVSIDKRQQRILLARKISRVSIIKILKLRKAILNFGPDVIISFLPEPSFKVLFLKKISHSIRKIPIIVSVRNDPNIEYNNILHGFAMKKLYPLADEMVLQTKDARKYFEEKISYHGVVIPNPVSDSFILKSYSGLREKRIVAVGRLDLQKNYKNMIDAFEIVHRRHSDYSFEIYGDGPLKKNLQKYIADKGLTDKILLMGKADDVASAIRKASVFVMSSDYEGMPNSLLEAACLGVPCVSTNCPCGGPKDILNGGRSGCLVPVRNPVALANGICKVIVDRKYSDAISKSAKRNSYKYQKKVIIQQWKSLIDSNVRGCR